MPTTNKIQYCCSVDDLSENRAIAEEFLAACGYDFSSKFDTETKAQKHILYFANLADAKSAAERLANIDSVWKDMGVVLGTPDVFQIEEKEWSEVWKRFFPVQHISDKVVIKPTWLEYNPKPGQTVIELDPGMSFGTGRHATTRFCIRMLERLQSELPDADILDAGCGSGILSIAAYLLGYRKLTAFDLDPMCLVTTRENMELNGMSENSLVLSESGLSDFSTDRIFEIVIANIMAHILVDNRENLYSFVKPGGYLILAGILTEEYCEVRNRFIELGLKEIYSDTEDEWTGGLFQKDF